MKLTYGRSFFLVKCASQQKRISLRYASIAFLQLITLFIVGQSNSLCAASAYTIADTTVKAKPIQNKALPHFDGEINIFPPRALDANALKLLNRWKVAYNQYNDIHRNLISKGSDRPQDREARLKRLPTDIPMPYNNYVKKSLDLYLSGKRHFVPAMLSLGEYYFPIIETIFDRYNIPLELKYLAVVESGMDPTVCSPSGAKGLCQFMLVTAKAYDLEVNSLVDERLDVKKSTEAAAKHLKDLYELYGDWLVCIAAYNAGIGTVNRAIKKAGGECNFWKIYPYLPRQTRDYVPLFIAAYYAMEYHKDYKFEYADFAYPAVLDTMLIKERLLIADVAQKAKVPESLFRLINPQFKGNYIPGNIHPYTISLPFDAISRLEEAITTTETVAEASDRNSTTPIAKTPPTIIASEPKRPAPARSYTIRKGDSLYKIAKRHGVSLKALMEANSITSTKFKLIPGKSLEIPSASS